MGGCSSTTRTHGQTQALAVRDTQARCDQGMLAKVFLRNVITTTLPGVRRAVEDLLIKKNEDGGLPLFVQQADESPTYKLRILKQGSMPLMPGDIFGHFDVQVLELRAIAAANSESTSTLPEDMRAVAEEVAMIDIEVQAGLDFRKGDSGDAGIAFQVHGERWWSPTLGVVSINTIHARAHVRLWWGMCFQKIVIAFLEEPDVSWDLEASLFSLGLPLPDSIEDTFVAWSLRKALWQFNLDNPLEVPLQEASRAGEHVEEVLVQESGTTPKQL
mmetsp:Transcript_153237/g.471418  ORF Transcript_153237/g.471418 Transcript_153237/m.471418 type:complete len:273 (-) Transcript_153237:94-912(-)